jgi:hypothetical protein
VWIRVARRAERLVRDDGEHAADGRRLFVGFVLTS